jgi:hypothetical protein
MRRLRLHHIYPIKMTVTSNLTAVMTALAGLGFLGQLTILWSIPVILFKMVGFSSFRICNDKDRVKALLTILNAETYSSSTVFEYGKERPAGVFIGWKCFGYYSDGNKNSDTGTEVTLFTTTTHFKELMEKCVVPCESLSLNTSKFAIKDNKTTSTPNPINIWNRHGSYVTIYYHKMKVDVSQITPLGCQGNIVTDIVKQYKERNRFIAFIHGTTGTGKSTIGLLIAKEMRGSYCHDFNPTEPGDSFKNLLRDTESYDNDNNLQSSTGPLVIVMEEVDTMIKNITEGTIFRHKNVMTSVHNKTTFNSFLDDMVFHKNIILIMTSNTSKEKIDEVDPSYLRKGRVNAYYKMITPLVDA